MKREKMAGMFLLCATLCGCSGQVYTVIGARPVDKGIDGKYLKGITAYPPKLYVETFKLTAYVHDGKILRTTDGQSSDKKCEPGLMQNIATRPDYSSAYQLVYEPGLLESKDFSIALKDGMITAVNVKSTPDRGETLKNILPTLADLSGMPMGVAASDERVLCNASPVLRDIIPYVP